MGGQQAQSVEPQPLIRLDVFPQRIQSVARHQHPLATVHTGRQLLPIGRQGLHHQLQSLLRGGAHIYQIHAALQKRRAGLQIRLQHLQLRAALVQIPDVHQIAAEVPHLREQDLYLHA